MTGFGASALSDGGRRARVEIRSVNHRGLKLNVKARPGLGAFEKDLRDLVSARLPRGAVDVSASLDRRAPEPGDRGVDGEAARAAVDALRRLARELGLDDRLSAADLLRVPGLFADREADAPVTGEEWPLVAEAARQAAGQAARMGLAEGEALRGALLGFLAPVERFAEAARRWAPGQAARTRARLEARLAELRDGGALPGHEGALEREILFYAERADIAEELDRLGSHAAQYRSILDAGGECGRRVEFVAQEMLREINTAVGKASDAGLSALGVEAKLAVERVKEQSANLE